MDNTQRLMIETYGELRLELRINWRTIEAYYVVSHLKHEEVFEKLKDAEEAFESKKRGLR